VSLEPVLAPPLSRLSAAHARMASELALSLRERPPRLPSKYLYDDRGAALFEEITRLPEYYQTRTEERLLQDVAGEVVRAVGPQDLLELGAGASRKIRTLIDAMRRQDGVRRCVLLDIHAPSVARSARDLQADYPDVEIAGVVGDFETGVRLPGRGRRLVAFFAGTIGNFLRADVPWFLRRLARSLGPGDGLLVGVDLVKDRRVLERAYNDARGVTARFNLNVLQVVNERLGSDIDLAAFEPVAFYDDARERIEMRLRARRACRLEIAAADIALALRAGEEILTEVSCKYTEASFHRLLHGTGLAMRRWFTDAQNLFALALLERTLRS
jgi:L-histidine N-alpha-methyltransferase